MGAGNGAAQFQDGGSYNVRVTKARFGTSRAKGTPQLEIDFIVTDGEMMNEELKYVMYSTEGRKEATYRELEILGFKATADAPWGSLEGLLVGKECTVTLKTETFNNEPRLKVDRLKAKGFSIEEGGDAGAFARVFGGKVNVSVGADGTEPFANRF